MTLHRDKLHRLSRRAFLGGIGAGSLALPLLPSLLHSETSPFPRRFLFVFSANGTIRDSWMPSGSPNNYQLDGILEPLAGFKDKITIIEGVDMLVTREGPGAAHQKGAGALLTGQPLRDDPLFPGGGNQIAGWAKGISADQHMANQLLEQHPDLPVHSLVLGVRADGNTNRSAVSYKGNNEPILPNNDPWDVFGRLFPNAGADTQAERQRLERLRVQRKSVLDFVGRDLKRLEGKIAAEDRQKVESHLSHVRSIERRFEPGNNDGPVCEVPQQPDRFDPMRQENFPRVSRLQMDLIASAFACDMTRVGTLMFSRATSGQKYSWLDIDDSHHTLSHADDNNNSAQNNLVKINTFLAGEIAYLMRKLDAIPEGDGSVLDNTAILWGSELSKGNNHRRNDMPFLLAGGCGGALKTGQWLKYDGDVPHNNLLVALCQAMGLQNTTSFGMGKYSTGVLDGVLS